MTQQDGYWRRSKLKSIVDGNTVRLFIDFGFRIYGEHSIRLNGVNTPKIYRVAQDEKELGTQALNFVIRWFDDHQRCGNNIKWPFMVHSIASDSFGRYLGEIFCRDNHCLNDELLNSGHAKPFVKVTL